MMDDQRRYDPVQDRWYVDVYQVKREDAWHGRACRRTSP